MECSVCRQQTTALLYANNKLVCSGECCHKLLTQPGQSKPPIVPRKNYPPKKVSEPLVKQPEPLVKQPEPLANPEPEIVAKATKRGPEIGLQPPPPKKAHENLFTIPSFNHVHDPLPESLGDSGVSPSVTTRGGGAEQNLDAMDTSGVTPDTLTKKEEWSFF